jgi:hypothetical protein
MADAVNSMVRARAARWARRFLAGVLLLALGSEIACTSSFFRKAADQDVEGLLNEKNRFAPWALEQYYIYPDPRARFADPTDPDHPPKPPDDYAAWVLSPDPQPAGKAGVQRIEGTGYLALLREWDTLNRCEEAARKQEQARQDRAKQSPKGDKDNKAKLAGPEPADQPADRDRSPQGIDAGVAQRYASRADDTLGGIPAYRLKLEQASELALFNSREFHTRREDLYLSALPVSLERFAFATQFFAASETIREAVGSRTVNGPGNRWRQNSQVGLNKIFPTGASVLFRLANQLVINLTGNAPRTVAVSNLTLEVAQPLLRGGGFAVTLEPLTQVERNLLYAIRDFARFRKLFYAYIAAGGNLFNVTFFGGVNLGAGARTAVATNLAGQNAPAEGYLPVVLRAAVLRNERENVLALEEFLRQFIAFKGGGEISDLQVGQVEQQLLASRATVLQREVELRDALDRFKLQLGLPTDTPLELDESVLEPIVRQIARYRPVFEELELARKIAAGDDVRNDPQKLADRQDPAKLRGRLRELFLNSAVVQGTRFREQIAPRWQRWEQATPEQLKRLLADYADEQRRIQERKTLREQRGEPIDPKDAQRLDLIEFETQLGRFELLLRRYEQKGWEKLPDVGNARQRERETLFYDTVNAFAIVLSEARNERLDRIREEWPPLPRLCVAGRDLLTADLDEALATVAQVALTNRFDLMNARAQLVDSWRQIRVRANDLMGVLDIRYTEQSTTPPNGSNPLAFSGSRTTRQLSLNAELPLVRRLERNNYRATLIAYQRQRRNLQASEDAILTDVRATLRQLRILAENYKIQQRALELAYLQVDNSAEVFNQPPIPGGAGNAAANAAALTNQLLGAQRSLPAAQNALFSIWINYQINRLFLYRDLELMKLDNRGVWIDDVATAECPDQRCNDQPPGPGDGGASAEPPLDQRPSQPDAIDQLPAPRPVPAGQRAQPDRNGR